MKWIAIVLAVTFVSISSAHAQRASIFDAQPDPWKDIKLGPFVVAGECLNMGTVSTTSPGFSYTAGAIAEFPITRKVSFNVALAYDAMSVYFDDIGYHLNYVAIRPEFLYNQIAIGVDIGVPASSSATGTSGSSINVETSSMNTLFEIRLGGYIPLSKSPTGVLDLTAEGTYALTNIARSGMSGTTMTSSSSVNNGPLATGEIGIQYLFDLAGH